MQGDSRGNVEGRQEAQVTSSSGQNGPLSGQEEAAALALEKRQHAILEKLSCLQQEVSQLTSKSSPAPAASRTSAPLSTAAAAPENLPGDGLVDIVINANPSNPPLSVMVLAELLSQQYKLLRSCHVHSSAMASTPDKLRSVGSSSTVFGDRHGYRLAITLIWKNVKHGASMMVSPRVQTFIEGESNVARYLARLLNPAYDSTDSVTATNIDQWLDQASQFVRGTSKERAGVLKTVNAHLGKAQWLVGSQLTLADIVMWSAIQQTGQAESVPGNVKKWIQLCNTQEVFQSSLRLL